MEFCGLSMLTVGASRGAWTCRRTSSTSSTTTGDIYQALANIPESKNISGLPPATISSTFSTILTTWKAEPKTLELKVENKMDPQDKRLEKYDNVMIMSLTTAVTKLTSIILMKLT